MARKLVDIDYYVHMGGSAYGALSEHVRGSRRGKIFSSVFAELAVKFQEFVDVLAEVRNAAGSHRDIDILRTYEIWLRTGSERAAGMLRELGIEPNQALDSDIKH